MTNARVDIVGFEVRNRHKLYRSYRRKKGREDSPRRSGDAKNDLILVDNVCVFQFSCWRWHKFEERFVVIQKDYEPMTKFQ